MRRDGLPGDGSLQALRSEHELNRVKKAEGKEIDLYAYIRVERLLDEIDSLEGTVEELMNQQFNWREADE